MNKKLFFTAIIIIVFILVAGSLSYYFINKKNDASMTETKTKMLAFQKENAFDTTFSAQSLIDLKGVIDKSKNFQGDILKHDLVVQNILKVGGNIYTKSPDDKKWSNQKNPLFLKEINILADFDNIQFKKLISDKDGVKKYEIIYDSTNGASEGKLSTKERDKTIYHGTATLDSKTYQLKELEIYNSSNKVLIKYTIKSNPPTIEKP